MDHMERVMLGVEALALLGEIQDVSRTGRASRRGPFSQHRHRDRPARASVRGLRVIAQLIDVGMLQIPREILWRPGPLGPEIESRQDDVERGHECLKRIEFPWPVAEAVRQHHERLDGLSARAARRGDHARGAHRRRRRRRGRDAVAPAAASGSSVATASTSFMPRPAVVTMPGS
jgi:hypothetical protein